MMAIVVYQLFYRMVLGHSYGGGAIIKFLTQVSLGAVCIGLAFGIASVLWLGFIFNDTVIEISLTLAVSYVAYFTGQEGAGVSGVLTVMTLGMFYAAVAKTAFKGDGQQSLHHFWEMIAYIANTLIFILSGVVIAEGVLSSDSIFHNDGHSWGYLVLLYVLVQLSRCIVVGVLFPFLRYFGYGLDWKEATILIWSGLRGAVALSLSLSVKRTSDSSAYISPETGKLFVFFTGGIVFLTLIVNGSTSQFVLRLLDMGKLSATKKRVLEYTRYEMLNKALEVFGDLGDDEELGPVDWPTVKRYIKTLSSLEGESVHPHEQSTSTGLDPTNLKDLRIRLLNGVQAAYWVMLEEGRITQGTANILMQSIDEAMDSAAHEPLSDWKGLKSNVNFPSHYKFLQTSYCPPKLVTYFTVERLESACYICAAFLRGHRIARQQLHDFIGDSDIASIVICESEAEGEDARKFLEDVRVTFPQVLRVVKTRQVTYSVLNHLIEYVQNLEKTGLLEQKEMLHLHDAVQTDLKRLLRNPPLVKIPKINDLINVHPLLGALPPAIREPLAGSSKEIMKLRGVPIYREGSNPTGVWFISNGVVKWTSKSMRSKYSLHPTFAHGSTLGLYEVLVRKPYICSMVTDSVVLGFFVESEKILSALSSDPAVADFFWQESAIVLAKLLLPQIFEKMSMHDLRALIVEKSTMTTYIRGETIEIPTHSVGFLLEGFIKSHGFQEELITSPAALFPQYGNQSSQNVHGIPGHQSFQRSSLSGSKTSSFSHQGMWYQVETRARVIIFNTASFEAEDALKRRSSSLVSVDNHMHRPPSREHGGLMSWPESFYKQQKEKDNHQTKEERPANSLSAKAMQLSMFGSMVDVHGGRAQSSSSSEGKGTRNMGKAASFHGYPSGEGPSSSGRVKKVDSQEASNAAVESGGIGTVQNLEERSESEDDDDEDVIIRIDSPSTLSFRQVSGV